MAQVVEANTECLCSKLWMKIDYFALPFPCWPWGPVISLGAFEPFKGVVGPNGGFVSASRVTLLCH